MGKYVPKLLMGGVGLALGYYVVKHFFASGGSVV